MKRKLPLLLCVFVFFFTKAQECGSLMKPLSIENRIAEATKIIEGEVLSSQSFWDINRHNIYTVHTVNVYKKIKGNDETTIKVVTKGGQINDELQVTSSAASLDKGITGIFFLKDFTGKLKVPGSLYKMVGAAQGLIKYDKFVDKASDVFFKYESVEDDLYTKIRTVSGTTFKVLQKRPHVAKIANKAMLATPSISSFSPSSASAGTQTVLTINGTNFGSTIGEVSFPNSNTGGISSISAIDSQIINWTDTQIQVEIPYLAGTGSFTVTNATAESASSASDLTITYNQIGVTSNGTHYQSILQDDDGNGGFTFQYHTDFDTSQAKTYFEEAFEFWNCESDINFVFDGTTTTDESIDDGINIVRFDNGTELASGVLGEVSTRFLGTCSVTNRAIVKELDITWNDDTNWYYGNGTPSSTAYDFKSVALHELGHAHQLGHVIDGNVIMHYNIGPGVTKYALSQNDIDGAVYTMGLFTQSVGCSITPMDTQINCCDPVDFTTQPDDIEVAENTNAQFTADASNANTYQWFGSFDGGIVFTPISDDTTYSGTLSNTLTISNASSAFDGYYYKCLISNPCNEADFSNEATLSLIEYTAIPDANFEAALEALGYDDISGDGQVPTALIETVTSLTVENQSISNLTGIEDFVALESLSIRDNTLTNINLTNNIQLTSIDARSNDLTAIDVSNNTALTNLNVGNNDLTVLDVSNNTQLTAIRCQLNTNLVSLDTSNNTLLSLLNIYNSGIASLDLSNNINVRDLEIYGTPLTSLDVSNNPQLEIIEIQNTNISQLDVSNNPLLRTLRVNSTLITTLDLSAQSNFTTLFAQNTPLEFINIQNGNNTNVTTFNTTGSTSLTCVLVDDPLYSAANWTDVESGITFSDDYCRYTSIPDANFEAALEALGYDDIASDGQVPTSLIEGVTALNLNNANISDLTGIEGFVALEELSFTTNSVSSVDLSNNLNLTILNARANHISTIDVSNNTELETLELSNNNLSSLDITNNTKLSNLSIQRNANLTSIDLSQNILLRTIDAFENGLQSINVSNNNNLVNLAVYGTSITAIDVSNNPLVEVLQIQGTAVSQLDLSNNPALRTLRMNSTLITELNLSNQTSFTGLFAQNTALESINIQNGNNTNVTNFDTTGSTSLTCVVVDDPTYSSANWTDVESITSFVDDYCRYTSIPDANFEAALEALGYDDGTSGDGQVPTALIETVTNLDVSNLGIASLEGIADFTALENLNLDNNTVTGIDLSNNIALQVLSCQYNNLSSLDLGANTAITSVACRNNQLTSLNVNNCSNLELLRCQFNQLSTLDVSANPLLRVLSILENNLTALDLSNNIALEQLFARDNAFTSMDLNANSNLQVLSLRDNNLEELSIKNGNNTAITSINLEGNTNLRCVLVDDAAYSTTNWTEIEAVTTFNDTECYVYTLIPDANFEARLEALGYDDISGDGQVPTQIAETVTSLNLYNRNISDLTGIEAFTALTSLDVGDNNLSTLDVSSNVLLESLGVVDNALSSLDLSNNTALRSLSVNYNNISSLNITSCTNLTTLNARGNVLETIDLSANINLETLNLENNSLNAIDLTTNTLLVDLDIRDNNLTALDISSNTLLDDLDCSQNLITNIDLSQNIALTRVNVSDNDLSAFDMRNGNNTAITFFWAQNNANLSCISVDDVDYSTTNWISIDNTTIFRLSDYCGAYTAIPDSLFENTLFVLGYDDIEADNQVPTEYISVVTELNIAGIGVADFTGLQDFTALTTLDCSNNQITSIDLSGNTQLQTLDCSNNNITSLDISANTALESLNLSECSILSLDTSANTALRILSVDENAITSIDLSTNTLLEVLDVSANSLSTIDLSNNIALTSLNCYGNNLSTLDLFANTQLTSLICRDNGINTLDLTANTNLEVLFCNSNNLSSLDVSQNIALRQLFCNLNSIETLDLTNNSALEFLNASDNALTALDVRNGTNTTTLSFFTTLNNPALTCISVDDVAYSTTNWTNIDAIASFSELSCGYTTIPDANFEAALEALGYDDISADGQVPTALIEVLTDLNVANSNINDLTGIEDFTALETLDCDYNNLTSLNISNNTLLRRLNVRSNDILALDLSNNTQLTRLVIASNELTELDVSNNLLITYIEAQGLDITNLDLSANTALNTLYAFNTNLTSLDLSNNVNIERLEAYNTDIVEVVLADNSPITNLSLGNTQISTLDLSTQTSLRSVRLNNTNLTSLNMQNGTNTNITTFTATNNPNLTCILVDDATYSTTNWTAIDATTSFSDTDCITTVNLAAKIFLQGPMLNPNTGEENLMRDDLRTNGYIDSNTPYGDGASISETVGYDDNGENSMVDWIWIELRDAADPTMVVAGQSAILQRDGDVVATTDDLVTPSSFDVVEGSYYLVIKHRNHLSIRSANTINLTSTVSNIDFTTDTTIIEGGANAVADLGNGTYAMLAGDYDENGQIQNSDINTVISLLGGSGYSNADMDMNGQIQNTDINNLMNPNVGKGEQF